MINNKLKTEQLLFKNRQMQGHINLFKAQKGFIWVILSAKEGEQRLIQQYQLLFLLAACSAEERLRDFFVIKKGVRFF